MMFCQYVLEPLEAILESLGAGLGVVLGLLGGPWGGSEHPWGHLGGLVDELEGARRAGRRVFYECLCQSVLLLAIEENMDKVDWGRPFHMLKLQP